MHADRRTAPPPWERRSARPRHPVGRVRRRWPRAYDGPEPVAEEVPERYRRRAEDLGTTDRRRWNRNRLSMDVLRQSPVRNGLIGLAVAGTAAPIAINRYQQAMRTDPTHEQLTAHAAADPVNDASISEAWQTMEGERTSAESERSSTVQRKMQEYASYNLTQDLAEEIYDMAVAAEVDPDVAFGLVAAESSFKNSATSRVGAVGLTQLMPATAKWLEKGVTNSDLRKTETNLRIGFKYLHQLIQKYDGNTELALTAYNRGPGTVDRILKRGGNPDNGYSSFVKTGKIGSHKG